MDKIGYQHHNSNCIIHLFQKKLKLYLNNLVQNGIISLGFLFVVKLAEIHEYRSQFVGVIKTRTTLCSYYEILQEYSSFSSFPGLS